MLATLHGRGLSGRSLARVLSSWRALYRFLIERTPAIGENPCAGMKAPKGGAGRLPDALSPDEAVRLVGITGDDPFVVRDRALLELLYSSGLRVSELAGADVDRIDLERGEIRVWGKGKKERIVPVGAPAQAAAARMARRAPRSRVPIGGRFRRRSGARMSAAHHRAPALRCGRHVEGLARRGRPHLLRHSSLRSYCSPPATCGGTGAARPRQHRQHPGLHPPRFPVSRQGIRPGASAGKAAQALTSSPERASARPSRFQQVQ